ncbi:uncharacterized protein LOC129601629 [Paramacrobiotus metropolitanus]|uniref:uncharacterized protein LOC129601629 n=1 Tax=Paramacrobiotus metropolitanus TaxID=2943436 RepID=UPI002445A139|nr:uncharacterized protein LOC129601629 [Paramacrobiotus metropolitanus]XP_055356469.1 uncharacterized protein LOC129601629 [Paramacrobiotus metropolitanus]
MDSSWGAMPRYRSLLVDGNQISYQNTVAVRNADATWWLGYIQDMDGDHALIHFDSRKVTARWIHTGKIWPLPFYYEDNVHSGCDNVPAYVALRDEEEGPWRFRPTILLKRLSGCGTCEIFHIRPYSSHVSVQAAAAPAELVERGQVAAQLPPSGPPLLKRRSDWTFKKYPLVERRGGLTYTKHFMPFAGAQGLLRDASDKFRVIKHFRDAFDHLQEPSVLWDDCRFHLRIERDGCMFIIINPDPSAETAQLAATLWAQVLDTHLANRVNLPPIGCGRFRASETIPCKADRDSDFSDTPARIRQLTPGLLSEVLAHLDLFSQTRTKRVCVLWELLLSSPRMADHISINMEICWEPQVDSNNCYKLAALLSRSVNATTKSLTLLNASPPAHGSLISDLLDLIQIKLPWIAFKGQSIAKSWSLGGQNEHRLKHGAFRDLRLHQDNCESMAVYNWKVAGLFGLATYEVFYAPFSVDSDYGVCRLPASEQNLMKHLTHESHELAIDKLQSTIPRLLLKCRESEMGMTSRFMCSVNQNFPPVTEDMLAKVEAVYARWVRSLVYPDEWQTIRQYLLVFSGFYADGSPRMWENVDLRRVDARTLGKLAIYAINEVFAV